MELRDYVRVLRMSRLIIALCLLMGVLAATAITLNTPPTFEARARVFVSTSMGSDVSDLQQGSTFTIQRVRTYAELVGTSAVLQPTVDALELDASVRAIRGQVSASVPPNTSVIDIRATASTAQDAADLATAVAEQLSSAVEDLETTENSLGSPVQLSIVQRAEVPGAASSPRLKFNLALGALLGLAIGLGIALLRSALDTRIHNEVDIEKLTDRPVLGGIPFDGNAKDKPLVMHTNSNSVRAEAIRSLRTNLQFVETDRPGRSFVVTSSREAEGKSTTSANLAIALSELGAKVLLVDADLRRPDVHRYMGVEGGVGLSDCIIGRVNPEAAIQRWGHAGLFVLSAGSIPPNPSELLGTAQMNSLVERFDSEFDVVIYDCAPLLPVTDTAVLARVVGSVLLVVASGKTTARQFEASADALDLVGAHVAGVILTMVPTKGADAYGDQRYGYSSPYTTK